MQTRHTINVINDASERGTDAYGLAVRIAAHIEAQCVQRMQSAAAEMGLDASGGDVESVIASIGRALLGTTEE